MCNFARPRSRITSPLSMKERSPFACSVGPSSLSSGEPSSLSPLFEAAFTTNLRLGFASSLARVSLNLNSETAARRRRLSRFDRSPMLLVLKFGPVFVR